MNHYTNTVPFASLKASVASLLCHRAVGCAIHHSFAGRIPHFGRRIEVPAEADPAISAMLFWRLYESAEVRFVQRYVDQSRDVLELGSSLGGVACSIAERLRGHHSLVCVEANGDLIDVLSQNLARNSPRQKTQLIHGAINYTSDKSVEFTIARSPLNSRMGFSASGGGRSVMTPSFTLGDVLNSSGLNEYTLVCDIEGAEVGMVLHDATALLRCRLLIIEMHEVRHGGCSYTPDDIVKLIHAKTRLRIQDRYGPVAVFLV